MDELGLQFLEPRLSLLAFGEISGETGEKLSIARLHLTDGKLHRKGRAVLALSDDDTSDTDDLPLASPEVPIQVAIVVLTVWRRYENLDVLADRFRRRVTKKPFCRMAERTYDPSFVDHHHGVRNRVEDRGQVRLAGK